MPSSFTEWRTAPPHLALEQNEVHVWRAPLEQTSDKVAAFFDLLATDEQHRANRFHFAKDRRRFIVARGIMRTLLGRYLNLSPESLEFSYSSFGKPALPEIDGGQELHFNLTHSGNLALLAFTRRREVGVDVEELRENFDGLQLAEHYFSSREVAALHALPAQMHQLAFFTCWTRKESYIKAIGEGLSHPLNCFDVSLAPGEPAALLCHRHDPREISRWTLRELTPGHGYVAAMVVEGRDWKLNCWQWKE